MLPKTSSDCYYMDILIPSWPVRGTDWLEAEIFQEISPCTAQSCVWTGFLQSHTVHLSENLRKY